MSPTILCVYDCVSIRLLIINNRVSKNVLPTYNNKLLVIN